MLKELRIQNLAIVPELSVTFGEGLNVLTGETGAGKSILMDAIGLLAGRRSSSEDVRAGATAATIEGVLELDPKAPIWKALEAAGAPAESEEIVIRRTISADGRSRAFVNNVQWTASGLADLAMAWIDISSQHGQQRLLDETTHGELLDTFGNLTSKRDRYAETFKAVKAIDDQLSQLHADRERALREKEFLTFQLHELTDAKLVTGEMESIEAMHQRISHSEKLARAANTMGEILEGESGTQAQVGKVATELRAAARLDESLQKWVPEAEELVERLKEFSYRVNEYGRKLDFDPSEVEKLNERLSRLQALARKYGTIDRAIAERDRAATLLASIDDASDREAELIAERKEAAQKLVTLAEELTQSRKTTAKKFAQRVTKELRELGMPSAQLTVEFCPISPEAGAVQIGGRFYAPQGAENARLDFAPNPGEGVRPLTTIASGGELSRVLLAMKGVAMAEAGTGPMTFVFDEVDTGIGGETAERVGIRLRALAATQNRQVLCVTHLAQIACYATTHLYIGKQLKSGRTVADIAVLKSDDRKEELARMIGGIKITPRTLDHAGELLRRGTEFRGSL